MKPSLQGYLRVFKVALFAADEPCEDHVMAFHAVGNRVGPGYDRSTSTRTSRSIQPAGPFAVVGLVPSILW